jgi:hypothetical protein
VKATLTAVSPAAWCDASSRRARGNAPATVLPVAADDQFPLLMPTRHYIRTVRHSKKNGQNRTTAADNRRRTAVNQNRE